VRIEARNSPRLEPVEFRNIPGLNRNIYNSIGLCVLVARAFDSWPGRDAWQAGIQRCLRASAPKDYGPRDVCGGRP